MPAGNPDRDEALKALTAIRNVADRNIAKSHAKQEVVPETIFWGIRECADKVLRRLSSPSDTDGGASAVGQPSKSPDGDVQLVAPLPAPAVQGGEAGEVAELIHRLRIINQFDEIDGIVASCREASTALTSTAEKLAKAEAVVAAAQLLVRCHRAGDSPYIRENGRHGGSPWAEFVDAVDALTAPAQAAQQEK